MSFKSLPEGRLVYSSSLLGKVGSGGGPVGGGEGRAPKTSWLEAPRVGEADRPPGHLRAKPGPPRCGVSGRPRPIDQDPESEPPLASTPAHVTVTSTPRHEGHSADHGRRCSVSPACAQPCGDRGMIEAKRERRRAWKGNPQTPARRTRPPRAGRAGAGGDGGREGQTMRQGPPAAQPRSPCRTRLLQLLVGRRGKLMQPSRGRCPELRPALPIRAEASSPAD